MNTDLMHAASEWLTEHDTCLTIVAELLELGRAVLAFGRHFAHSNLVADDLDRLFALDDFTVEGEKLIQV